MSTRAANRKRSPSAPVKVAEIQPIISTDALSDLDHVIHPNDVESSELNAINWSGRPTTTIGQWKQIVTTSLPLVLADVAALLICFGMGVLVTDVLTPWRLPASLSKNTLALTTMYLVYASFLRLYPAAGMNVVLELREQMTALAMAHVTVIMLNALVGVLSGFEVWVMVFTFLLSAAVVPVSRNLARNLCCRTAWWGQPVIIVGGASRARAIHDFLIRARPRGLRPIGVVDTDASWYWKEKESTGSSGPQQPMSFLGTLDELHDLCRKHGVIRVIAITIDRPQEEAQQILAACSDIPTMTVLSSRLMLPSLWTRSYDCAGMSGIHIQDRLLSPLTMGVKRLVDILGASVGLILAIPVLIVARITLWWLSPGPLFYGHPRLGRRGKPFKAWKIRTMVPDADKALRHVLETDAQARDEWEKYHKLLNDPRIVGGAMRIVRALSLDELPQLWNVLVGEMSLVGPRPVIKTEIERYGRAAPIFLGVRPGLTGLWQVSGRNNTSYPDRVRLDTYYVRNWSLWLDYYILLRTIKTVILREGAY